MYNPGLRKVALLFMSVNKEMSLENFQAQFNGCYNTPYLFVEAIDGLQPLLLSKKEYPPVFEGIGLEKIRLGQRVERFVSSELITHPNIEIIAENLQIQTSEKHTIGELDVLYRNQKELVHLEIQFKYYLYDPALGTTEMDHCIGPMRRDTLNQKLTKLKERQLPLLYAKETKPYLDQLGVSASDFIQRIYFKAQLFIPYGKEIVLKTLNPACIYGYYITYAEFECFKEAQFYKPKKTDWLLDVTLTVDWISYQEIQPLLQQYKREAYAPMLWICRKDHCLIKCFVIP